MQRHMESQVLFQKVLRWESYARKRPRLTASYGNIEEISEAILEAHEWKSNLQRRRQKGILIGSKEIG